MKALNLDFRTTQRKFLALGYVTEILLNGRFIKLFNCHHGDYEYCGSAVYIGDGFYKIRLVESDTVKLVKIN